MHRTAGPPLQHSTAGRSVPRAPPQQRHYRRASGRSRRASLQCEAQQQSQLTERDLALLKQAAELSGSSAGVTAPHPNAACVLVNADGRVVAQAYQRAQGTESAESQAVRAAGGGAAGCTAYLNLESGDCHGDDAAVAALLAAGVARVVVGLHHPLQHLRGQAAAALRRGGVEVAVLGHACAAAEEWAVEEARSACLMANEALLHRAVTKKPLGLLKYAMTLDGKIATSSGHSAWVSSPASRAIVFETRARSDAVVVGGCTVRRDNPQLTTRREGGHTPARIVMSRTLDLPPDAKLWDVSVAPTIVMTQRGARTRFQALLRERGVEVVEFDFLTPEAVAGYCYERGFLQVLWECGGMLSAPAIQGGAIHKVMAFIAPKLVGGTRAPTPVGDLGFVEMTQAVELAEPSWRPVGSDLMLTGYLPASGGLNALEQAAGGMSLTSLLKTAHATPDLAANDGNGAPAAAAAAGGGGLEAPGRPPRDSRRAEFYKAWDEWGALSNFSPHPIAMPEAPVPAGGGGGAGGGSDAVEFASVEHFYQSQKVAGVAAAREVYDAIVAAQSPEEAARIGRRTERLRPELMRPDWHAARVDVMRAALAAKFGRHAGPRAMLLASAQGGQRKRELVEASPHDFFWGRGFDGSGLNMLGRLLHELREQLQAAEQGEAAAGKRTPIGV